MATDTPAPRVRSDAARNRDRLRAAAAAAFEASAGSTAVSLEGIARDAGVGIGTLYRHFPTREALVEEVYRAELGAVCDTASTLLATLPPAEALRAWMDRYGAFVAAKRGMAETLRALLSAGVASAPGETRQRIRAAVGEMLAAGAAEGTLRADVAADDVVVSLIGVFLATAEAPDRDQAGRMLDLLVAGLRARA
ncbi:TetR/AcrR family transcriptional regulator [Frondihabitans australicus]|uniref:TetR family transcriptional regulator n=1 Tax=Frondihabitans australicus TaxID=386892 RepID=A0A495IKN3_9MICO|nr:TetR/AcrR family transcriptional regulator [Frondihabitans australicus]RKR76503.1 TetR family transcriptional regulator [Frondihabitans australicus]